ncbi:MAG: hypothetical protein QOH06_2214 [Acidobacteriota bacterium]|jgi:hypothetical protein|nr:hypothetical protein [Acidobacteriota bacterium]
MRERFQEWAAGLSEEDFACALAAFGVLGGRNAPAKTQGVYDWRFDPGFFTASAADLAEAWRTFRAGYSGPVSIRLDRTALLLQGIDPLWLQSQFAHGPGPTLILLTNKTRFIASGAPELVSYDPTRGGETDSRSLSYSVPDDEPPKRAAVKSPRRKPESRRLYAQLVSLFYPVRQQLASGALRPGKSYAARIGVGLPGPDRKDVGKPIPDLGEDAKGHDLTVIWQPRIGPGPEVQTLHLPREGDSGTAEFRFQAPADAESFEARVTILHANRVLQTGLLKAPVGTEGDWTFGLDAAPRTRLKGLDDRTSFDAAIVLDRSLTAASDGQAVVLDIDDHAVQTLTQVLGREISKIAVDPARYKGLASAGSVELLRELAQKGSRVHRHLRLDRLKDARRIHITSVRPESFFPAELLYSHRPPSPTAGLCPHALKALKAGDCTGECPSDKEETICPLGFWGLSKVIERHAGRLESHGRGNVELRPEPVGERNLLPISGSALLAASCKASSFKKDAVTRLLDKLKKRGTAVLATTWDEWEQHIKSEQPRLLVLLPHHDRDDEGEEFLEIGEGERLETDTIWVEMVRRDPGGPNPVVLLMGCETNLTEISFENPAVVFQDLGAAVVVTTIATILGRHASPATEALVQLLDKMADGKHTFGDIMLRLRQKLVATSTPMALGLTSYGDADWLLTREG